MAFMIHICNAILEEMDLESGFEKIFASVADAIFRRYAANVYVGRIKKFKNFSQSLTGIVDAVESGILLYIPVTSFVESKFFVYIWKKIAVYLSSVCACDAVRRPDSALFLER